MRAIAFGLLTGVAALSGTGCVGKNWLRGTDPLPMSAAAAAGDAAVPGAADDLSPEKAGPLALAMAESLDKGGKEDEAIAYYERARGLSPATADKAARRLAVLYDRADQQAKAMAEFQELLKKHPKDAALLNDVGYSYYNRGDWAQAEAHLRRAVAADKKFGRAWVNLGLTLAQQGNYTDAADAFGKAVTPAEVQANLGFVMATQGKRDEAKQAYRKALELEPTLKVAHAALEKLDAPPKPAVGS